MSRHGNEQTVPRSEDVNAATYSVAITHIIIIIISGFGIYGAALVPDSGVGNTWQRLTLILHEFLSNGLTPSRLHIVISFLTQRTVTHHPHRRAADRQTLGSGRLTRSASWWHSSTFIK